MLVKSSSLFCYICKHLNTTLKKVIIKKKFHWHCHTHKKITEISIINFERESTTKSWLSIINEVTFFSPLVQTWHYGTVSYSRKATSLSACTESCAPCTRARAQLARSRWVSVRRWCDTTPSEVPQRTLKVISSAARGSTELPLRLWEPTSLRDHKVNINIYSSKYHYNWIEFLMYSYSQN